MRFEKLSGKILSSLEIQGYNILISNSNCVDQSVVWFAERTKDVNDFFLRLDAESSSGNKSKILFIDYAIKHIDDKDLIGDIFIY